MSWQAEGAISSLVSWPMRAGGIISLPRRRDERAFAPLEGSSFTKRPHMTRLSPSWHLHSQAKRCYTQNATRRDLPRNGASFIPCRYEAARAGRAAALVLVSFSLAHGLAPKVPPPPPPRCPRPVVRLDCVRRTIVSPNGHNLQRVSARVAHGR